MEMTVHNINGTPIFSYEHDLNNYYDRLLSTVHIKIQ